MKPLQGKFTYANVMATIAVFIALGGSAYAASQLKKNSVGSKQLKKNAVTEVKIKDEAITAGKIQDGAISPGKLADGAVTGSKLSIGAVGPGKLAPNSVTGAEVAPGSLTTTDLAGADSIGTLHGDAGAVAAHSCTTSNLLIPGAEVGDALFLTFVGSTAVPAGLTFQLLKVTGAGEGAIRFCNPTNAASPAFDEVGIRVIALR